MRGSRRALVGALALVVGSAGVTGAQQVVDAGRRFFADDPLWVDPDRVDIGDRELPEHELSMQWDFLENVLGDPASHDGPAINVNTLGEVPDSTWFENRVGLGRVDHDAVVRGPNVGDGPQAPLRVVGRPGAGITPKFTVEDARGDRYVIKIDPPEWPELASTAEFVATKLFWALGYHVPQNYVHWLDPATLTVREGATFRDAAGYRQPLRQVEIDEWLRDQPRSPEGRIRVLASKFIIGTPIGPRKFYGVREDDPNDLYPHELRRDVRALRVFSAWLNHDDSRAPNSFDTVVEEDGRRFVRHYLIDFGSALGSRGTDAQEPRAGYEYFVEFDKVLTRLFSLGLHREGWEKVEYPDYPAVGRLEADYYEPWLWRPQYPNPAFDRMDAADAFWAAGIMARIDDAMIRAIVDSARMGDPEQARYLADTIIQRRDDTVRYWIARTNPLDAFVVTGSPDGARLSFDNAAVRLGAAPAGEDYTVAWARLDNLSGRENEVGQPQRVAERTLAVPANAWGPVDDAGDRHALVRIGVERDDRPLWREPVEVALRARGGAVEVVGIVRPHKSPEIALAPPDER